MPRGDQNINRDYARLYKEIADQPAPPCEEFNCPMLKKCAKYELACIAFKHYIAKGAVLYPETRERKVYYVKRDRRTGTRRKVSKIETYLGSKIIATHTLFEKIHRDPETEGKKK